MSGVVYGVLGEAMVTVGGLWCAELDLVLYGDRPVVVVPGCLCLRRQPSLFFDESP